MVMLDDRSRSFASLLCAVSFATDLSMDQPIEHGLRTAHIAIRLAEGAGLPEEDLDGLFFGALLKDVG
jgi:HD-GYP domain-containing protein (c-di-GMP phosphodiesterase class II)